MLGIHPVFLVVAVAVVTREVSTMLLVPTFLLLLLARGLPVLLYRSDLPRPELLPFALSASVASLALVVVIIQIGLRAKSMDPDIAQALVGAALLSVLIYPILTAVLLSRPARSVRSAESR